MLDKWQNLYCKDFEKSASKIARPLQYVTCREVLQESAGYFARMCWKVLDNLQRLHMLGYCKLYIIGK